MSKPEPKENTVIDAHPKLIAHFAKSVMRHARDDVLWTVQYVAEAFSEKQQQLIAEYIRRHRKRTREKFI